MQAGVYRNRDRQVCTETERSRQAGMYRNRDRQAQKERQAGKHGNKDRQVDTERKTRCRHKYRNR